MGERRTYIQLDVFETFGVADSLAGNSRLEPSGIIKKIRGRAEKEVFITFLPRILETFAPVLSVLGKRRPVLLLHCHKVLLLTVCSQHRRP